MHEAPYTRLIFGFFSLLFDEGMLFLGEQILVRDSLTTRHIDRVGVLGSTNSIKL